MLDAVAVAQGSFEGRNADDIVRLDSLRQEDQQPLSCFAADRYQQNPEHGRGVAAARTRIFIYLCRNSRNAGRYTGSGEVQLSGKGITH